MDAARRSWKEIAGLIFCGALALLASPSSTTPAESSGPLELAAQKIEAKDCAQAQKILDDFLRQNLNSSVAHNLRGICEAQTGQLAAARKSFEKAIKLDPKYVAALVNLGNLLLATHKESVALKQFEAALAHDPDALTRDPTSYTGFNLLGLCRMDQHRYSEAQRAFERALQINSKFAAACVNLGNALLALKCEGPALQAYLSALKLRPEDSIALSNVGLIYGRQENFGLAVPYLEKAHQHAPRAVNIAAMLAEAYIRTGRKGEAKALLDQLAQSHELDRSTRESLASLLLETGDASRAVETAKQDSESAELLYGLGYRQAETDFEQGKNAEARETLEAIRGLRTPDARFHDLLGSVYYVLDDPKKASDEFQEAIHLQPADSEHYFKLAMVFLKHRTPEPAIYVFETALQSRPDVPNLWLGLGLSYYFAHKYDPAMDALNKAISLDPNDVTTYIVLGDLLSQTGRSKEAMEVLRKAIAVAPSVYLPYYYYGKISAGLPNASAEEVMKMLRKSVALNPSYAQSHFELGKALLQLGNTSEAIEQFQESLKLEPKLADAHYQLAQVYRKMGDAVRAKEEMRFFQGTHPTMDPEDAILRLDFHIEKQ